MKKTSIYLSLVAAFAICCSNGLPLSDLANNSITLKVMGTYESNDPYPLQHAGVPNALPLDDIINGGISGSSPVITGGSDLYNYVTSNGLDPRDSTGKFPQWQLHAKDVRYYIDIAEIRLAEGQGKSSSQSISDYWSQFAITRQLMCSDYGTTDPNRVLSNCQGSSGIERLQQFFNGGFSYPAADVATGNYNHMGIYFRRFATYPAAFFTGQGQYVGSVNSNGTWATDGTRAIAESLAVATFDNRSIYGADIEGFLQNPYGQSVAEPLMFPLQRKDLALRITNGAEPYVMEVRVFLQNLMMVHVRQISKADPADPNYSISGANNASVYVAPADWNADHVFRETDGTGNSGKHGGAVVMAARVYQPAHVGRLVMDATFNPAGREHYFVAVAADSTIDLTTTMPLVATPGTKNVLSNLPPGAYKVYRTCDVKKCGSTSVTVPNTCTPVTGTDGFPESVSLACHGGQAVTVTAGTDTSVTTASCATINGCP
jgi:hypothetical protein